MADFKSIPLPFKLRGMNLTLPPDQLPPDQAAALVNVRPQGSGQVVSSPGTTNVNAVALADTNIHSLSRLNDFSPGAANPWLRLIGAGTNLYSGQTSFISIQGGFSGNPLSFSFARPSQAVSTWAYIADSAQMKKTNSGNLIRDMGIRIIPTGFPAVLFTPAINQTFVAYDFSSPANFSVSGTASTLASGSRLSATNIAPYNPLISNKIGLPNPSDFDQLGVGSVLDLSIGGAVRVNARHQIGNTSTQTLQAQSDGGAGSEMSVSIPASLGVEAGTLVTIGPGGSQITSYVQTAVASLEGQDCLRMFTGTTVYSGATDFAFTSTLEVSGVISGTTTVASYEVSFTVTTGTGACYLSGSLAGFGAMLPTQNVHVSININEPEFVTNLVLMMSLGNTPTSAGAYAFAVIDASTLVPGEWTEIFIPQGAFTFVGDPHDLNANGYISLQVITTGQVNVAWGSLTFDTSSGPDAGDFGQPYFYRCRFRDPTTGATSITFPASTTAILPRNIPLDVLGPSYTPGGYLGGTLVVDFERFGGSLTSWNYVATATGNGFYDIYPDSAIATNGPLTPVFPPFPVLGNPITGTYKIIGISLIWVSGGTIPLNLAPGTLINVADASNNTTQTLTLAAVINASTTIALTVEPFQGDPTQTYTITIPNPILLNTPLPVMWGPYPQGLFNFCVGDPLNPGSLYVTNANDPDSSSDANTIEITSPNEPLMNGAILGSDSFVITSDRLLLLQATFTDFASGSGNLFQAQDIPASKGHGLTDTYAFCVGGGAIWWKASDGIYCYDGAVRNISDADLWPLFQHGGQPAQSVTIGGAGGGLSVTVPPPQVGTNRNRLCYKDGRLYFDYIAQGTGNPYTLIYDIRTQGWWLDIAPLATLAPRVRFDESSEDLIQTPTELLLGIGNGFVALEGGSTYSGTAFNSLLFTGTLGVGELTRSEKQWGDLWFDIFSPGVSTITIATYANFYESLISTSSLSASAGRNSYNVDLNTGGGFLAKNVAIGLEWSPGLSLFQWAPSLVVKPETTNLRATDWDNAGSPQAKYIMGCEIECDTLGVNQIVNIETEGGGTAATVTLNANGQQVLAFAFPPFIAHDIRLAPTSNIPWRFFGVRWISQPYPEDTTQFTEWSDAGQIGSKYIRGLILDCDTLNSIVAVHIGVDQTLTGPAFNAQANGRSQIEIAFDPPFIAQTLQLQPQTPMRIFGARWIFDPYPELSAESTAWDQAGFIGSKYIRGVVIECDTLNAVVAVAIETDAGGAGPSLNLQANGRTTLEIAFTPFTAQSLRLQPSGTMRIFAVRWVADPYPEDSSEYTSISPINGPGVQYIRGLILEADTGGVAINVNILGDAQALLTTISVTASGRTEIPFPFNPPLIAHVLQLAPQGAMRIFNLKWIADPYPESAPIQTAWEDGGYSGLKYIQGLVLNADSSGSNVTVQILTDGDVNGPTFIANHQGQVEKPYSFTVPFLAHSLSLAPQGNLRIFGARWIFNPAPELTLNWITPPSSLGMRGYAFLRDGWIAYASTANVTLTILLDGVSTMTITLPSTSGVLAKAYVVFSPNKFRTIQFELTSPSPFQIMKQDCEIRLRSWGQPGAFQTVRPFGDQNFTTGAVI